MTTANKILVADDSLTIRKLVETVLRQEGYEVITAETGGDCLTQAATNRPDLILLDYILPDMKGTEVCRSLINSPETWEIPVLLMSSNGNAIRQLYQDLNNVSDYLTKPFAPNVLKAVVGHLLKKGKPVESGETSSGVPVVATPEPEPQAEASIPRDFMDKVSRLLNLMENGPAAGRKNLELTSGLTAGTAGMAAKKPRRARKSISAVPPPDVVQRKFRLVLQKRLRMRMKQIPDWEAARGPHDPEDFFLGRVLSKDVLCDLASDLVRATGVPAGAIGALNFPTTLLPLDAVLRHLQHSRATGELSIETGEETVVVCFEGGQVIFISTNHPRNYCAGASCEFQTVPHAVIGDAVRAQEEQSIPFFITLKDAEHLPAGATLEELLRAQGEKCLVRAFKAQDSIASFFPLAKLPAAVRANRLTLPLNQLLLACYRTVDDWFTLEKAFPDMEATLAPAAELEDHFSELELQADEARMVEAIRVGRTVTEVATVTRAKPFEVCCILFRFIKLGLVRHGARRDHDERVDEVIHVTPAQAIAADASSGSAHAPAPEQTVPSTEAQPDTPSPETAKTQETSLALTTGIEAELPGEPLAAAEPSPNRVGEEAAGVAVSVAEPVAPTI